MNTSKNEFLSAFLDGEAGEFERRRLRDELSRDEELGQTLSRYAMAGEIIRSKQRTVIKDNAQFLAGIQAGLEDEPGYSETVVQFGDASGAAAVSATGAGHWRTNVMRYGMAASVAVAALVGVLLFQSANEQKLANGDGVVQNDGIAGQLATATGSQKPVVAAEEAAEKTLTIADSSRLNQTNRHLDWQTRDALKQYVTLHMQHRVNNGIVPSIQAVSYSK